MHMIHYKSNFTMQVFFNYSAIIIRQTVEFHNKDRKVRIESIKPNDSRAIDKLHYTKCYITHILRQKVTSNNSSCEKCITAEVGYLSLLQ